MCLARGLAYGTAPPGLLLEVKDPEVLVTDALCEETDTVSASIFGCGAVQSTSHLPLRD